MKPRIALVLGGGGSRGIAHIGVLEILQRENIKVDLIVGTSMGAIIGSLYASGLTPQTIAENMSDLSGNTIFSMNIFSARARQRDVEKQLERALLGLNFSDLKIPFVAMAVDVIKGTEVCLKDGPLIPAILASCAVPAVFPPVAVNDIQLADGGVIDSLATNTAHAMNAEKIIAVDIYPPLETDEPWIDPVSAIMGFQLPFNVLNNTGWSRTPSIIASMWRSFRIMAWHVHEERLRAYPPDVLIRPEVGGVGSLDFTDIEGPLEAGRKAAEQHIDQLRTLYHGASTKS